MYLLEISERHTTDILDTAIILSDLSRDDPHQGALADTVWPDECEPVRLIDDRMDITDDDVAVTLISIDVDIEMIHMSSIYKKLYIQDKEFGSEFTFHLLLIYSDHTIIDTMTFSCIIPVYNE